MVFQKKEKKEINPTHKTSHHLLHPPGLSSTPRDTEELPVETAHVPVPPNSSPAITFSLLSTLTSPDLHHCGCRIELYPLNSKNKADKVLSRPPVCTFSDIIKKLWTDFNNMVKRRSGECLEEMLSYDSI